MYWNKLEYIAVYNVAQIYYHAKFGVPDLKRVLECKGIYWNVQECIGMYRNVLEYVAMYMNGLDIKAPKS